MPKANTVGEYFKEDTLKENVGITGTTAITIYSPSLDHVDGISFQLVFGDYVQPLVVAAGDSVAEAAGTATWTFANGAFTAAMVGGTFVVTGAANAANNGTKTIAGVTSATVVTTTTVAEVDETFTAAVNVTVTLTSDPVQATVAVAVSDDFVSALLPGLNQVPTTGNWATVTAKFADTGSPFFPAIAAITADGSAYYQMYPLVGRRVRWIVTPTDGTGNFTFLYSAKGNR